MKRIGIIIFIVLSLTEMLFPASRKIRFDHLSIEQGLSQCTVFCIFQDSKGFMWFGTGDGLNKYDGYRFTDYRYDPKNPHSLSSNIIYTIHEDRQGQFWIGTARGGLNKFDGEKETFIHYGVWFTTTAIAGPERSGSERLEEDLTNLSPKPGNLSVTYTIPMIPTA